MSKLEVIVGSMFCGKTEELIRRVKRATFASQKIRVLKPVIDDRFGIDKILSHAQTDLELVTKIKPEVVTLQEPNLFEHYNLDLVAFDEAQFFDPILIEENINKLLYYSVRVICAGLDLDSFGKPFGCMPMLLSKADEVTKLKAVCVVCKSDANRTYRKATSKEVNFIGGKESYEPRCRVCWELGNLENK